MDRTHGLVLNPPRGQNRNRVQNLPPRRRKSDRSRAQSQSRGLRKNQTPAQNRSPAPLLPARRRNPPSAGPLRKRKTKSQDHDPEVVPEKSASEAVQEAPEDLVRQSVVAGPSVLVAAVGPGVRGDADPRVQEDVEAREDAAVREDVTAREAGDADTAPAVVHQENSESRENFSSETSASTQISEIYVTILIILVIWRTCTFPLEKALDLSPTTVYKMRKKL